MCSAGVEDRSLSLSAVRGTGCAAEAREYGGEERTLHRPSNNRSISILEGINCFLAVVGLVTVAFYLLVLMMFGVSESLFAARSNRGDCWHARVRGLMVDNRFAFV